MALSAVLFVLLTFQSLGWLAAWWTARFEARQLAQAACYRSETRREQVTIPLAVFRANRAGRREIRLHGRLYDIHAVQFRCDSVVLDIFHDAREEALYATLGDLLTPAWQQHAYANPGIPLPLHHSLFLWMHSAFLAPEVPRLNLPQVVRVAGFPRGALLAEQAVPARFGPPPEAG